jgi:hypothetical protein
MTTTKVIRLKRWKVEVFQETSMKPINYTVIAADEMDARVIAFCLAGGFSASLLEMQEGDLELVKMYTNVPLKPR